MRKPKCSSAPSATTRRCARSLHETLAGRVDVEEILELPAVRMHTVPGFETAVFSYFSDIPFLTNWGTPLLLGPGSIHVAHTDREHIAIDELNRAVDIYEKLGRGAAFRRKAKVCQTKGSARNLGNLRAANRVRAGRQQR